jgi:lipopolysaccharide biosynthesis glycosyltransferase
VSSLLRHNPDVDLEGGLHVVVATDALPLATTVLSLLASLASVKIDVVNATDLMPDTEALRTEYGLFTPGHRLSIAAYYRLFAVQALSASIAADRIVYLDSDTCVRPGASGLFDVDLHGQPLAARSERAGIQAADASLNGIAQAARRLGLDPHAYFNSGVLIFDATHSGVGDGLARAIHAATEEPELLTFHDQCALNLGFSGLVSPLPESFNHFVRPAIAASLSNAVVAHYLERPKPWDALYPATNAGPWLSEFSALSSLVGPTLMADLLRSQFRALGPQRDGLGLDWPDSGL